MLSIAAMGTHSESYYLELSREDYYLKGGEPPGLWFGRGAERLGLSGKVEREPFRNLFRGFSPDGSQKLVQNAGTPTRHPGWDLTFNAPKSVSVFWSQADEHTRHVIEHSLLEAAADSVRFLEETAVYTRRGTGGAKVEKGEGLVVALFPHGTSRAQDPHQHVHSLVLNTVTRADGSWGTVFGITSSNRSQETVRHRLPFFQEKMVTGALFQASLAAKLQHRLGLAIEPTPHGFELAGVPKALMDHFSTRRKEIEEELGALGDRSAKAAAKATLLTRERKAHIPRSELFARWLEQCKSYDFRPERLLGRFKLKAPDVGALLRATTEHLSSFRRHFSSSEFLRDLARRSIGTGLDAPALRAAASRHLEGPAIQRIGQGPDARFLTAKEASLEPIFRKQLHDEMKRLAKRSFRPVRDSSLPATSFFSPRARGAGPRPVSEEALSDLTQGGRALTVLRGPREEMLSVLRVARRAWAREGEKLLPISRRDYKVIAISPGRFAASEFRAQTGIRTLTPDSFLRSLNRPKTHAETLRLMRRIEEERGVSFGSVSAFLKYAEKVKRKPWLTIDKGTVVVVDMANVTSLRDLSEIAKAVRKGKGKLVLLGDPARSQPTGHSAGVAARQPQSSEKSPPRELPKRPLPAPSESLHQARPAPIRTAPREPRPESKPQQLQTQLDAILSPTRSSEPKPSSEPKAPAKSVPLTPSKHVQHESPPHRHERERSP